MRLVKDINGQPNIIGDGINVAQRVMSFAEPGQILVSRSYYDVMARLSEDYAKLFHYEGAQTDKHVREHEVYAIGSVPFSRKRASGARAGDAPPQPAPAPDPEAQPATLAGPWRSTANCLSLPRSRSP